MKKRVFGRHLNRDTNERRALFKNLMTELVLHEQITTTHEKARAIRGQAERLVTKAKRKGQASEYLLQPFLSADAVKKIIADLAPRFADRPGGYTRIIKLGNRLSDNASMAIIEWVVPAQGTKGTHGTEETKGFEMELEEPFDIQEAEIVAEESKKTRKVSKGTKEPKEPKGKKKTEEKKTTKKKGK